MLASSYDCIVLGGGPAGSTAAAFTAKAGLSTLLVEREKMPRFHVGESLMPECYWTFERLGVLDKLNSSEFVKKYSVQFVNGSGKESAPFFFDQHDQRECSQTWQVERADFDQLLFDHAADLGATCLDETRALDVLFDDQQTATGVRLQLADGSRHDVGSKVVIDGTGQQSLIANKLNLIEPIPELRKAAIWTYFKGAAREAGKHGGATLVLHTKSQQCWFWYIPLSKDVTSVGLVGDNDYILKTRSSPGDAYCEELSNCPAVAKRIKDAEMLGEFHVAKEFSYTSRQHAGNGWVLVGDAFGFIDPIYSSGVFFALKTGELAADAVVEGIATGQLDEAQLGGWTDEFKEGAQWVRKLVDAFYTKDFSFGQFMKQHPEHMPGMTDILIGRIFHEQAGDLFDDMESMLRQ
jgi:flavin-dependent dehydrogenase